MKKILLFVSVLFLLLPSNDVSAQKVNADFECMSCKILKNQYCKPCKNGKGTEIFTGLYDSKSKTKFYPSFSFYEKRNVFFLEDSRGNKMSFRLPVRYDGKIVQSERELLELVGKCSKSSNLDSASEVVLFDTDTTGLYSFTKDIVTACVPIDIDTTVNGVIFNIVDNVIEIQVTNTAGETFTDDFELDVFSGIIDTAGIWQWTKDIINGCVAYSTITASGDIVVTPTTNPDGSTNYDIDINLADSLFAEIDTTGLKAFVLDCIANAPHSTISSTGGDVGITATTNADGTTNYDLNIDFSTVPYTDLDTAGWKAAVTQCITNQVGQQAIDITYNPANNTMTWTNKNGVQETFNLTNSVTTTNTDGQGMTHDNGLGTTYDFSIDTLDNGVGNPNTLEFSFNGTSFPIPYCPDCGTDGIDSLAALPTYTINANGDTTSMVITHYAVDGSISTATLPYTQVIEHNIQTTIISDTTQLVCIVDNSNVVVGVCDTIYTLISYQTHTEYNADSTTIYHVECGIGLLGVESCDTILAECNACTVTPFAHILLNDEEITPVGTPITFDICGNDIEDATVPIDWTTFSFKDANGNPIGQTATGEDGGQFTFDVNSCSVTYDGNGNTGEIDSITYCVLNTEGDTSANFAVISVCNVCNIQSDSLRYDWLAGDQANFNILPYFTDCTGSAVPTGSTVVVEVENDAGQVLEELVGSAGSPASSYTSTLQNGNVTSLFDTSVMDDTTNPLDSINFSKQLYANANGLTGQNSQDLTICYTVGDVGDCSQPSERICVQLFQLKVLAFDNQSPHDPDDFSLLPWYPSIVTGETIGSPCSIDNAQMMQNLGAGCTDVRRFRECDFLQDFTTYTLGTTQSLASGVNYQIGQGGGNQNANSIGEYVPLVEYAYGNTGEVFVTFINPLYNPDFETCDTGTATPNRYLGYAVIFVPDYLPSITEFCFEQCGAGGNSGTVLGEACICINELFTRRF